MTQPLPYCITIIEYGNPLILYTPNFRFIVEDKWSICSVYFRICGCDSHRQHGPNQLPQLQVPKLHAPAPLYIGKQQAKRYEYNRTTLHLIDTHALRASQTPSHSSSQIQIYEWDFLRIRFFFCGGAQICMTVNLRSEKIHACRARRSALPFYIPVGPCRWQRLSDFAQ